MISPRSSLGLISPQDLSLPTKFSSFYPWQEKAIIDLCASEYRTSLLSAPTGTGKTLLSISVARMLNYRTLYLTSTKGLQDQSINDFGSIGLFDIRGHSNYPCATTSYDDDGELSDISCSGRRRQGECDYQSAVDEARSRQLVTTNVSHWIMMQRAQDPDRLGRFDLLILDEAHNAERILVDSLSVKLYARTVRNLLDLDLPPFSDPLSSWQSFAREAISIARSKWAQYNKLSPTHSSLPPLTKLGRDLARFLSDRESHPHSQWISEETPFRGLDRRGVILSPVWGKHFAETYLFRSIPRVILTSATLTEDTGCYLGLKIGLHCPAEFYEIASTFDPKRRPLIYLPSIPPVRVDHRMSEGAVRIWMNRIDSIIAARPATKGIIAALSFKRAREIVSRSKNVDRLITHHSGQTKDTVEEFKSSTSPLALVSPSVEEGYDFPNSLCRWQILVKVPFIDTRSPLMQARLADDKRYGDYLTAQRIIQISGRGMRAASDWCETFLTDSHWEWFQHKVKFPRWFKAAWRQESKIPPAPRFN